MISKKNDKQANDEIDVSQNHPTAAVPCEAQIIKCIPVVVTYKQRKIMKKMLKQKAELFRR